MHRLTIGILAAFMAFFMLSLACTAASLPVLLNADFTGDTFGFLGGVVPAGFTPRVLGAPSPAPVFGRTTSDEVTIHSAAPGTVSLDQPLNAGFGSPLRFRVPIAVTGDATCRIGLIRHEVPEEADFGAAAGSGETVLELSTRADHPGALFRIEFSNRDTAAATLLVRRIDAVAGE